MAYRAAAHVPCDGVIALGGDLPPDVVAQNLSDSPKHVLSAAERGDEWFSAEKLEEDLRFLRTVADVTVCVHAGGHEWTDEFRQAAGRFLRTLE